MRSSFSALRVEKGHAAVGVLRRRACVMPVDPAQRPPAVPAWAIDDVQHLGGARRHRVQ